MRNKKLIAIAFMVALFIMTSSAQIVVAESSTTVVGTGNPTIDVPAVQLAVDSYGTVNLEGTFDFGENSVIITTAVTIRGEGKDFTKIMGAQTQADVGAPRGPIFGSRA